VEPDLPGLQIDQPLIADRHAVRVLGQVLEELFWSSSWRFGVHGPLGFRGDGELALELDRVRQGGELPVERKLSPGDGAAKQSQELPPKHAAEHAHRQEESWPACDPTRAIGSEPTPRHDAMHMRMVLKVLDPCVEDGQETDLSTEVLGVGGDLP
jgi:hypothetical protein